MWTVTTLLAEETVMNLINPIKKQPILSAALLGVVILSSFGVTLKSGQFDDVGQEGRESSNAAIKRFWTVYHGNDFDSIPEVQRELQTALQRDPNNATLYALLGATHFWHIGEYTRRFQTGPGCAAVRHADGRSALPKGSRTRQ